MVIFVLKKKALVLSFFLFLLLIAVVSFLNFSLSFYEITPADSDLKNRDAIVVLAGGRGRLPGALALFLKTQSHWLLISGVGEATSIESIFSKRDLQGVDYNRVILERESKSTLENAEYALNILLEKRVRSVVLVTSNYHMKRALYIFQNIFPENIEIISYAIESDNFMLKNWWKTATGLKFLLSEFIKYWWYRLIF